MNFPPKERKLLNKLGQRLPRLPQPGWEKDRICAALGEDWETVLSVIFKCRKAVELRKPGLPLIKYGNGGYCLVGSTGKKGHLRLF